MYLYSRRSFKIKSIYIQPNLIIASILMITLCILLLAKRNNKLAQTKVKFILYCVITKHLYFEIFYIIY